MDGGKRKLSKEEYEALARKELLNLERDFRRMKSDREAVKKKTKTVLANQKKVINILEKEKEQLLDKINSLSKSKVHEDNVNQTVEEVESLLKQYEKTVCLKKEKAQQLEEVKGSVRGVLTRIEEFKRSQIGNIRDHAKEEKTDEQLKSSLHEEAGKFNQIVTDTEKLRKETGHLLSERIKLNKMVDELITDLSAGKKMIFDMLDQSDEAFERRRKGDLQLVVLKGEAVKDFRVKVREVWVANQAVEQSENLNKFIETKGKFRDNSAIVAEKELEEQRVKDELVERLNCYEAIVHEIIAAFHQKNLDKLILEYKKIEEDNYNIYSFLSNQTARTNAVEIEVKELEKNVWAQMQENQKEKVKQSAAMVKFKENYLKMLDELKVQEKHADEQETSLQMILVGIKDIFENILCDWQPFLDSLGRNKGEVVGENVRQFLFAIEQRLQKITTHLSATNMEKSKRMTSRRMTSSSGNLEPLTRRDTVETVLPVTPCPLCAEVLDTSDKTTIEMPLQLHEVKALVAKERMKGRWHPVMHSMVECPLPQAQRIMQKKRSGS